MELLAHVLDNDNLTVKYIPEDIKALFETPSGFAIDSGYLYDIGSDYTGIETIWVHCVDEDSADFFVWLKRFLKLTNRSTAISTTGIDESLAKLIEEECNRGQKLIVGESAYKEVIEAQLEIPCVCDEATEELMWGLHNLLHDLVPEEKSKFGKQDRKYHSKKLLDFLHRNVSEDIKPEMINGKIALLASVMRRCDVASKEYSDSLHQVDNVVEERSGLKTDCWDTVTYATALMTLIGESVVMPDGFLNRRCSILLKRMPYLRG
ncbi:unnamed protein product [Triticum aestivum]|uniref:Uncharacterized protein n=1 Tax=Triticum aestivum TaxID=4565 RepID=A0A7H4LBB5_WHEAT|nr:unnamed protein product [Triticum aestivum]